MLLRIFSILILSCFLYISGIQTGVLINFKIHQTEIAEAHCINKTKKELNCNGKCYLHKQLQQLEQQEQDQPIDLSNLARLLELNWFYELTTINPPFHPLLKQKTNFPLPQNSHLEGFPSSIFIPPVV